MLNLLKSCYDVSTGIQYTLTFYRMILDLRCGDVMVIAIECTYKGYFQQTASLHSGSFSLREAGLSDIISLLFRWIQNAECCRLYKLSRDSRPQTSSRTGILISTRRTTENRVFMMKRFNIRITGIDNWPSTSVSNTEQWWIVRKQYLYFLYVNFFEDTIMFNAYLLIQYLTPPYITPILCTSSSLCGKGQNSHVMEPRFGPGTHHKRRPNNLEIAKISLQRSQRWVDEASSSQQISHSCKTLSREILYPTGTNSCSNGITSKASIKFSRLIRRSNRNIFES